MLDRNKKWQKHLPIDYIDEANILNEINTINEFSLPQNLVQHTLDDYYRELINFDPEDPGSVVDEESKNPIFRANKNVPPRNNS